ncbi:MAG: helix-turn-helix domain-containing protein, partial [Pseudobdellovibrionaceae bacterium]
MNETSLPQDSTKSLFVSLLKQEYQFRQTKNPRYSMRSFAKCLEVDQSLLTKILNGKRNPSKPFIQKVNERLGVDLIEAEQENEVPDSNYQAVEDTFHLMSEWYHFALLELARTKEFVAEEDWICKRLRINPGQLKL